MAFASGTWGSGGALVFAGAWYLICRIAAGAAWPTWFHAGLGVGVVAASVLSVRWGEWAVSTFATHYNTRKDGDPGAFVLD